MKTAYEKVSTLYRSGRVKRLHCIPTVNHHTVAQHVYGSMLLGVELCDSAKQPVSKEKVLMALLYHDAAEIHTGDIPAPVKRRSSAIANALMLMEQEFDEEHKLFVELTPTEQGIVKLADALDLAFNCLHERELGNRTAHMERVFKSALDYAEEIVHPGTKYFTGLLRKEWENV